MVTRRQVAGALAATLALAALIYLWRYRRVCAAIDAAIEEGGMLWPCDSRSISCPFGPRTAPTAGASTDHNGIDIATPQGSPVYAVEDGTVSASWLDETYGGGNSIRIAHADGLSSHYCHLSKRLVAKGETVTAGQPIALSGGSPGTEGAGVSTGPHLHFALKNNGIAFNPMDALKA